KAPGRPSGRLPYFRIGAFLSRPSDIRGVSCPLPYHSWALEYFYPGRIIRKPPASIFGSGFVAPWSQPHFGGCSLVAPRQNRKSTPQTRSYLWNGVRSRSKVRHAASEAGVSPGRGVGRKIPLLLAGGFVFNPRTTL